jgi:hypothetical protein
MRGKCESYSDVVLRLAGAGCNASTRVTPTFGEGEKMTPPIYPTNLTGTAAQQYLYRATMFRRAATSLSDYSNGETFWPKYALLNHAIELALKAFAFHHSVGVGRKNHDLRGWYKIALQCGLQDDTIISRNIDALHDLHVNHFARYPVENWSAPVPDLSVIADQTVDQLISAFTPVIVHADRPSYFVGFHSRASRCASARAYDKTSLRRHVPVHESVGALLRVQRRLFIVLDVMP